MSLHTPVGSQTTLKTLVVIKSNVTELIADLQISKSPMGPTKKSG